MSSLLVPAERTLRHAQKIEQLVRWIAAHGHITVPVATALLGLATESGARGALGKAARAGALTVKHLQGPSGRPTVVATLSPEGIARAQIMGLEPVCPELTTLSPDNLALETLFQRAEIAAERAGQPCERSASSLMIGSSLRAVPITRLQPRDEILRYGQSLLITPNRTLAAQLRVLGAPAAIAIDEFDVHLMEALQ